MQGEEATSLFCRASLDKWLWERKKEVDPSTVELVLVHLAQAGESLVPMAAQHERPGKEAEMREFPGSVADASRELEASFGLLGSLLDTVVSE
jgi:hypothetical protein